MPAHKPISPTWTYPQPSRYISRHNS